MNKQHFKDAVSFGRALIRTRDLDPVYVALAEARLPEDVMCKTLLAYFCLYHLGVATYIGSQKSWSAYWDALELAAGNKDRSWPRGTERRHWRGRAALDCTLWFQDKFEVKPEAVLWRWYNDAWSASAPPGGSKAPTFSALSREIQKATSFGPWIAFKVADMMERVLHWRVDFSDCALGIYREPLAGAALLLTGDAKANIAPGEVDVVIEALLKEFRRYKAPPFDDRPVNVQEIETILCKYKSHCNGHYPVGKDTREVLHALLDPRWGPNAGRMRFALERLL